jgi:hypothetical protein
VLLEYRHHGRTQPHIRDEVCRLGVATNVIHRRRIEPAKRSGFVELQRHVTEQNSGFRLIRGGSVVQRQRKSCRSREEQEMPRDISIPPDGSAMPTVML